MQNRFPRQPPWCHLGFLVGMILALFYLQVTQMLPTKFGISCLSVQEKRGKTIFLRRQPWWPSWISDQNDLSYLDLLVTPMLVIKFQDNRSFVSGEEAKNRFSR